jgi:hypothetical protein
MKHMQNGEETKPEPPEALLPPAYRSLAVSGIDIDRPSSGIEKPATP